jgi:hypothetical protein
VSSLWQKLFPFFPVPDMIRTGKCHVLLFCCFVKHVEIGNTFGPHMIWTSWIDITSVTFSIVVSMSPIRTEYVGSIPGVVIIFHILFHMFIVLIRSIYYTCVGGPGKAFYIYQKRPNLTFSRDLSLQFLRASHQPSEISRWLQNTRRKDCATTMTKVIPIFSLLRRRESNPCIIRLLLLVCYY